MNDVQIAEVHRDLSQRIFPFNSASANFPKVYEHQLADEIRRPPGELGRPGGRKYQAGSQVLKSVLAASQVGLIMTQPIREICR